MSTQNWDPHFYNRSPIFKPFKPLAETMQKFVDWPTFLDLENLKRNTGREIVNSTGQSICFVNQENAVNDQSEQPYESRIYLTGEVTTRVENWHDFFNALVWMTFPRAKAALNRIHYEVLLHASFDKMIQRGPRRDAATLFDESGVIVLSTERKLIDFLQQHAWKELFWQHRKTVLTSMRFVVFGHALYEKALHPYVGMTGKGVFFQVEEAFLQRAFTEQLKSIDQWLGNFLLHQLSAPAGLSPVPILGYPGWSNENNTSDYYDNRQYFRSRSQNSISE